jgi:polyhydroxyalkanoate synthesis regulator protein
MERPRVAKLAELRRRAARGVDFAVIDANTGDDITRIMLA